jgi:hypothetical protein
MYAATIISTLLMASSPALVQLEKTGLALNRPHTVFATRIPRAGFAASPVKQSDSPRAASACCVANIPVRC